ncbi:hypothetical protein PT974_09727 [Cladobotryum mycophilum]|uniref:Uncharacterized protein n=1 Tax=Cladobotryum mycophilum TaxID=491253 RepID=A0ABR0SI61_9HYPO
MEPGADLDDVVHSPGIMDKKKDSSADIKSNAAKIRRLFNAIIAFGDPNPDLDFIADGELMILYYDRLELARPLYRDLDYPIEGERARENVDKLRGEEQNLDAFWVAAHCLAHSAYCTVEQSYVQKFRLQNRPLQRTPIWIEQPNPRKLTVAPIVERTMSPFFVGPSDDPTAIQIETKAKTKLKTRGTLRGQVENPESIETNIKKQEDEPQTRCKVEGRALKAFRTLSTTRLSHLHPERSLEPTLCMP